jgi:hypothetical protein
MKLGLSALINDEIVGVEITEEAMLIAELEQLEALIELDDCTKQLFALCEVEANLVSVKATVEAHGIDDALIALIGTEMATVTEGFAAKNVEATVEAVGVTLKKVGKQVKDFIIAICKKIYNLLKKFVMLFASTNAKLKSEVKRVKAINAADRVWKNGELKVKYDIKMVATLGGPLEEVKNMTIENLAKLERSKAALEELAGRIAKEEAALNMAEVDCSTFKIDAILGSVESFIQHFADGKVFKKMQADAKAITKALEAKDLVFEEGAEPAKVAQAISKYVQVAVKVGSRIAGTQLKMLKNIEAKKEEAKKD